MNKFATKEAQFVHKGLNIVIAETCINVGNEKVYNLIILSHLKYVYICVPFTNKDKKIKIRFDK